jgi:hypothetical protein
MRPTPPARPFTLLRSAQATAQRGRVLPRCASSTSTRNTTKRRESSHRHAAPSFARLQERSRSSTFIFDEPSQNDLLVRVVASGLCHSDDRRVRWCATGHQNLASSAPPPGRNPGRRPDRLSHAPRRRPPGRPIFGLSTFSEYTTVAVNSAESRKRSATRSSLSPGMRCRHRAGRCGRGESGAPGRRSDSAQVQCRISPSRHRLPPRVLGRFDAGPSSDS